MKIKIFYGFPDELEEKINEWFASKKTIFIIKSLQSQYGIDGSVTITIIYGE